VNKTKILICALLLLFITVSIFIFNKKQINSNSLFISYIVDLKNEDIKFYYKNEQQINFKSIGNLKNWLEAKQKKLVFAMNGGMYKQDNTTQGLFIENKKIITPLDTMNGEGNFYLKPNGVFYISVDNLPTICSSTNFKHTGNIKYATQSGPLLLIDGQIHSAFNATSTNLNIRNGLGILPNNQVVFAMSKKEINFYEFASYFKKLGCLNALYLDGLVSRMYLPQQNWIQTDGNFGVIIGIIKD
jgi:uncharacterized protein YigE (DUF2233 family)